MKIPHLVLWSGGLLVGCLAASAAEQTIAPAQAAPVATHPAASATAAIPSGTPLTPGKIQAFIVQGDVQLVSKTDPTASAPLTRGQIFEEGTTVKLAPGAQALLVFSNGGTLKLFGGAELSIDQFKQAPFDEQAQGTFLRLSRDPSRSNTVLDLRAGNIQGEFKQLDKDAGSTFVINTAKGSFNIEGSFGISAAGEITHPANPTLSTPAKPPASTQAPSTTPATKLVTLTVDPKAGAITGGSVSGSASRNATAQDLANLLTDTINQARAEATSQVKQN